MAKKPLYLDYAATTPVDARVMRRMMPYFRDRFGNPGSIHRWGQEAIAAVDRAREEIARTIGARFNEVIFTASATEANNLALRGTLRAIRDANTSRKHANDAKEHHPSRNSHGFAFSSRRLRIIVSAVEHESVLETARDLEREGVEVITLPVSREGIVDCVAFRDALNEHTVLVSVMYANHEVGTVQPLFEIAKSVKTFRDANTSRKHANDAKGYHPSRNSHGFAFSSRRLPLFHTDAAQAFQYLDCNVDTLGVDLMTLSSHKIYGPKGVGALYARNWKMVNGNRKNKRTSNYQLPITNYLSPLVTGGGQEYGLRSGTENVPAIVGFGAAAELAVRMRERESRRISALRGRLMAKIEKLFPDWAINGSRAARLPHNIHVRIPGIPASDLIVALDRQGIAISAGSACAARSNTPSPVIQAMGFPRAYAEECVRITLGRATSFKDIDALVRTLVSLSKRMTNN